EGKKFLKKLPHKYYEENLVHFFMIALIKDFDECVKETERFLPYIDCWSVCDQSSPKAFKKKHDELLPLIKKWIDSNHVYTSRFGMRMLMNEFLGDDFKPEYLKWVASKKGEDYYLKMMIAWYFATALAKQYDASIKYFEEHRLDEWTHKKAIQKAIESFRVSEEHKEYLKSLK
ncbi:MAG: DNA alkylation repair protein, partial [Lachnospiraceae bacterium]|nr:DNA alkylation repair protein [Lachnospiraceae bacterium]